jgi:hypothetical protein
MSFVTTKTQDLHNHILTVMTKFTYYCYSHEKGNGTCDVLLLLPEVIRGR